MIRALDWRLAVPAVFVASVSHKAATHLFLTISAKVMARVGNVPQLRLQKQTTFLRLPVLTRQRPNPLVPMPTKTQIVKPCPQVPLLASP